MIEWALRVFGGRYIVAMMLATRIIGSIGGSLTIYYANLTLTLDPELRRHWHLAATAVIAAAVVSTVWLALWETRSLRSVLQKLRDGGPIDQAEAQAAGRESVQFAGRHHVCEAILVPAVTVVPACLYLGIFGGASLEVLGQIAIAAFLGIAVSLMCTFFMIERCMVPVTRLLLSRGIRIEFQTMPPSRLQVRMNVCFGLIIVITALMIGSLANRRALEISRNPEHQLEAVANLREHTIYISLTAVVVGLLFSRMLANSVASRVGSLVSAMQRVQAGSLSERVQPTGTDEIDELARQFNAMVEQLDRNDQVIRDLNVNLEEKVRRRTRQLQRSKQSLQQSLKKLQEYDQLKTEFFSNISHELRTPLTMILAPIDRILRSRRDEIPADVSSHLRIMQVNAHRLLEQINRLLEFSKLEAGRTELNLAALELNSLVRDLMMAADPLAEQRGLSLTVQLDPTIPAFAADEEKVDTILSNLLSNALKFTPNGGSVRVETRREGNWACVAVCDTGIGIASQDYQRIFERFVQIDGSASRSFSGTGLGLALSRELVELHGGEIQVESEFGLGSRFWFKLPLTPLPPIDGGAAGAGKPQRQQRFADLMTCAAVPTSDATGGDEHRRADDVPKILVADDTPEMRILVGDLLSDYYQVVFAGDGVEGLDAVRRESPDLIISDVMMPNMDGYEFCRRIKEDATTRQIPFVMLTAKAELSMKIEGLNCGADDYLVKPFDAEELQARVRSLLKLRRLNGELDERNSELELTLLKLRSTQSQLVQSEKMSSLGQLVAGIAHEINNSINAVYNGIQPLHRRTKGLEVLVRTMLDELADGRAPELRQEIETAFQKISVLATVIENGATRTARIVSDLKSFSHPGSETPESFDLNEALEMCLNLLSSQTKQGVSVRRQYGDLAPVFGPCGKLNQVFMNILSNALQAMPDGGEMQVATRLEGEFVVVTIRDSGVGIPESLRNRIFDPFFTTKPPGVGTGLGLSISYGIVTQLGGTIECSSGAGRGTEFVIRFPWRGPAADVSVPAAAGTTGEGRP